jgi:hypothetical protein
MKGLLFLILLAAPLGAVGIGDSYDSVIAEKGKPKSTTTAGTVKVISYDDMVIKFSNDAVVWVRPVQKPPGAPAHAATPSPAAAAEASAPDQNGADSASQEDPAVVRKKIKDAIDKVVLIVNQPVEGVPRTMVATYFPNGWFHPGAARPDFDNADVRRTQETAHYAPYEYVYSNLDPATAFPGNELEFNSALKFFYRDRSVPKKKLSESEMLEINRLYRIIGGGERALKETVAQ